ncbi:MAG: ABC transporter permease [Proteobacteria bacterium]|nr:ABC transporter permease [Pseudomonadota bacterium]
MSRLWYFVQKELLLLSRDLHGLLLLFAMPTLFILIMTFALQNQYGSEGELNIEYQLLNQDGGILSQQLVDGLDEIGDLKRNLDGTSEHQSRIKVASDESKFLIIIEDEFEQKLIEGSSVIRLEIAPGTKPVVTRLIETQLQGLLSKLYFEKTVTPILEQAGLEDENSTGQLDTQSWVSSHSLYGDGTSRPSSVQQNVPGWLLFSMFFIAIPLSNTLIGERQQGTLARLQTMGFPSHLVLLGKLIPYFFINLLQVVFMLLVGIYLVPALGGERLVLGNSPVGLILISVSASLAAVAYALFIAQLANTTEQATILSGVCNIIMAAIGGVMVPRFIMPPTMQELILLSPMAWGLDGFLDIFLRNGNVNDVLPKAGLLLLFCLIMLVSAALLARRRGFLRH